MRHKQPVQVQEIVGLKPKSPPAIFQTRRPHTPADQTASSIAPAGTASSSDAPPIAAMSHQEPQKPAYFDNDACIKEEPIVEIKKEEVVDEVPSTTQVLDAVPSTKPVVHEALLPTPLVDEPCRSDPSLCLASNFFFPPKALNDGHGDASQVANHGLRPGK